MSESTRTLLIVGGVAVVAYLVYKKTTTGTRPNPITQSTSGTGNGIGAATQQGSNGEANFWQNLGSIGAGLNQAVSSVESTYNSIYGGPDASSTDTGQGNNGTLG